MCVLNHFTDLVKILKIRCWESLLKVVRLTIVWNIVQ